jgi:hypothetical protein
MPICGHCPSLPSPIGKTAISRTISPPGNDRSSEWKPTRPNIFVFYIKGENEIIFLYKINFFKNKKTTCGPAPTRKFRPWCPDGSWSVLQNQFDCVPLKKSAVGHWREKAPLKTAVPCSIFGRPRDHRPGKPD